MIRGAKFWITMVIIQVVFGLAIFAGTRQYYRSGEDTVSVGSDAVHQPFPVWPDPATANNLLEFGSALSVELTTEDPVEISRRANEYFANKQYDTAADLYEQLLALAPNNVEIHNNLGITLHYLGRSTEALGKLNEGVAIDPTQQRIWLTLGFVNSQVGNIEQARAALTTAEQMGADNDIGRSARSMLEDLP